MEIERPGGRARLIDPQVDVMLGLLGWIEYLLRVQKSVNLTSGPVAPAG